MPQDQYPKSRPRPPISTEMAEDLRAFIRLLIIEELARAAASDWEPLFGNGDEASVCSGTINRPIDAAGGSASWRPPKLNLLCSTVVAW
jgi:hypothetical protein